MPASLGPNKVCDCGNKATIIRHNELICDRCNKIEGTYREIKSEKIKKIRNVMFMGLPIK